MIPWDDCSDFIEHHSDVLAKKMSRQSGQPDKIEDYKQDFQLAGWNASQVASPEKNWKGMIFVAIKNKFLEVARQQTTLKRRIERNHTLRLDTTSETGFPKED